MAAAPTALDVRIQVGSGRRREHNRTQEEATERGTDPHEDVASSESNSQGFGVGQAGKHGTSPLSDI